MSASSVPSTPRFLDLTTPSPLEEESSILSRTRLDTEVRAVLDNLTAEMNPGERRRRLADTLRRLPTGDIATLLTAAAKQSLTYEPSGVRLLFDFLEVKRPGVEVLRQLETLSSLERVSLKIVAGSWVEPEESADSASVFPILEVLEEATRVGVLDIGVEVLPRRVPVIQALYTHLRNWFGVIRSALEEGEKLPDPLLHFLTQLAMVEISLLEKRLLNIASSIDPYDVRALGRLMPVLSRYDQDIEHMKSVVSRLVTYQPFYDRFLTMEHALSTSEILKLDAAMASIPAATGLRRILESMRAYPMLNREFVFLISLTHQISRLRTDHLGAETSADLLGMIYQVVTTSQGGPAVHLRMEDEVADAIWPVLQTWGVLRRAPQWLEVRYRDDRAIEFIEVDGTPKLPHAVDERTEPELSLRDLVLSQLQNDSFLMGILENPKAVAMPGIVALIATHSRSLRVLDRICRRKNLYTGTAVKDVPRILLESPARIPLNTLRRFMHVRFVSKMDLLRLARRGASIRSEVRREIESYSRTLQS